MSAELLCAIVAAIVAFSSVIVPYMTAKANHEHNYKMHIVEFAANNKLQLYQEFFDIMSETLAAPDFDLEHALALRKVFSKVYLVCNNQTREQLDKLQKCIYKSSDVRSVASSSEYKLIYDLLTIAMREDLKSLRLQEENSKC